MSAKGFALRSRVRGVRARAASTSVMVHIVHLDESVHLCVSGGPWEFDMRALNGVTNLLLARAVTAGGGEVRGGERGMDFLPNLIIYEKISHLDRLALQHISIDHRSIVVASGL